MDRFIIVDSQNSEYIGIIFHILRKCGYNMALTKRLFHWIPSYSKRNIRRDCQPKTVVLVWNEELNDYTSTFQMYKNSDSSLYIRKIATLPQYEGKGIEVREMIDLCETMPLFADHRVVLVENSGFFKNK